MGGKRITCYICFKPIGEGEASGWRPYLGDFHKACFMEKSKHPRSMAQLAFFRFDKDPSTFILEVFLWIEVLSVFALFLIFASIAAKARNADAILIMDAVTLIFLSGLVPLLYNRHMNTAEMKRQRAYTGHVLGPGESPQKPS